MKASLGGLWDERVRLPFVAHAGILDLFGWLFGWRARVFYRDIVPDPEMRAKKRAAQGDPLKSVVLFAMGFRT